MMYNERYDYTDLKGAPKTTTIYKGSIIGWLKFTNSTGDFTNRDLLDASLIWNKKSWTNACYPIGFTNQVSVLGAGYHKPPDGTNSLHIVGPAAIEVSDGNLATNFTNRAIINLDNQFDFLVPNVNTQKLAVVAKTGQLKGSFYHPSNTNTAKATSIWGAILQDQNVARGYFTGTNQTGSVRVR